MQFSEISMTLATPEGNLAPRPSKPEAQNAVQNGFLGIPSFFVFAARGMLGFITLLYLVGIVVLLNEPDFEGEAIMIDFVAFWGAAKMVLAGLPADAYNYEIMREAQGLAADNAERGNMPWLYPPPVLLLVAPFGLLPFSAGFMIFNVLSFVALFAAVRRFAPGLTSLQAFVLCSPAVMLTLVLGQLTVLWCAGLLVLLGAIQDRRWWLAGLMLALVSLKPQLALLVPVALVAAGYWRVIGWGAVWMAGILTVSTLTLGLGAWEGFFGSITKIWSSLDNPNGLVPTALIDKMLSWFALLMELGVPKHIATPIQTGVTLCLAGTLAWIWSRPNVDKNLAAAALLFSIPLATPYSLYYEMVMATVGCIFLLRAMPTPMKPVVYGVVLVWAIPLLCVALLQKWLGDFRVREVAPMAAPILTAMVATCVWQCWRSTRRQD